MPLTKQQIQLIAEIDYKTKINLKQRSSEPTLLTEMLPFMPEIKRLMDSAPKKEIEMYFYQYNGFYYFMKVLENLAQRIENGEISVHN